MLVCLRHMYRHAGIHARGSLTMRPQGTGGLDWLAKGGEGRAPEEAPSPHHRGSKYFGLDRDSRPIQSPPDTIASPFRSRPTISCESSSVRSGPAASSFDQLNTEHPLPSNCPSHHPLSIPLIGLWDAPFASSIA